MRISRYAAGGVIAIVLAVGFWAVPAQATVHEIVAQWCSGQDPLNPPGISRPGSKNFARPLAAIGMLQVDFDPVLEIVIVTFDWDHPASKVQSSGILVPIGTTEEGVPIFLDVPEPDPNFPAFQRCPKLAF
jgi:hypothetical protein